MTSSFLLDLIFYIIITPVISVTLTRIMFQSENAMIVDDALQRIDSVLHLKPLEETKHSKHPQNASVELKSVHFSYDGEKEVLKRYFTDHSCRTDGSFCRSIRRWKNNPCQPDFPIL